jgi:hypothetical protein
MKVCKLVFFVVAAFVALAAAVTAIVIFRDEIAELFAEIKNKFESKRAVIFHNDEFTDYADI